MATENITASMTSSYNNSVITMDQTSDTTVSLSTDFNTDSTKITPEMVASYNNSIFAIDQTSDQTKELGLDFNYAFFGRIVVTKEIGIKPRKGLLILDIPTRPIIIHTR